MMPIWLLGEKKHKILKTKKDYKEEVEKYKELYQEMRLERDDAKFEERKAKAELVRIETECESFKEKNKELRFEIKNLTSELNQKELESLTSDKEIQKAKDKIELLELQLKDTKQLLEEYKALPDLKNMIDNLSSLTTPSIDKLVEVIEKTNVLDDENKLSEIDDKLESIKCLLEYFSCSSHFR